MKKNLTLAAILTTALECASPDLGKRIERMLNADEQVEVRKLEDLMLLCRDLIFERVKI